MSRTRTGPSSTPTSLYMPPTSLVKFHDICLHPSSDAVAIDNARRQIDLDVQRLEEHIRTLRSRRNFLAPIARLPPEILSKIFSFWASECSVDVNPLDWVKVSHVSQHWRAVALECPSLWSTLVIARPKWCEEMLKRSKMAPLILKANLTYPTPKVIDTLRLALLHAPRIRDLHLFGPGDTIEQLLSDTSFNAPLLRSLTIGPSPCSHFGVDRGVHIPDNVLQAKMPYLRKVELIKCTIRWESPLVNGLVSLKIHEIPSAARPTMAQLMDALENMPALEVLELQNALPRVDSLPLASPIQRIVSLHHLIHIAIMSAVQECTNFVNCINVPPTARVHLSCSYIEESRNDFSGILKVLSSEGSCTGIGKRLLRTLHVDNETLRSLVVQGWVQHHEKLPALTDPSWQADIRLHLSWSYSTYPHMDMVLTSLCTVIQLSHLRSLRLSYTLGIDKQRWLNIFGTLHRLRIIQIAGPSACSLIDALREEQSSPSNKSRKSGLRSPSVYFPALKTLTLQDVSFSALAVDNDPFENLRDCLMERWERKAEITELRLRECSHLDECSVDLLRELVVNVDWDCVEKGFTDEEDDYDYGLPYGYDDEYAYWESDSDLEFAFPY